MWKNYTGIGKRRALFAAVIGSVFLAASLGYAQPPGSGSRQSSKKADFIIDTANKKNISGFIHICYAEGSRLKIPSGTRRGLINLKEAMMRWTKIDTKIDQRISLSSPKMMKMPFIYIAYEGNLDLTGTEKKNLKEYLLNGGFLVIENLAPVPSRSNTESGSSFSGEIRAILESRGRVAPIPNRHALYRSFFDFEGPPRGNESNAKQVGWQKVPTKDPATGALLDDGVKGMMFPKSVDYLEGLTIDGRLAAVYSSKRYVEKWQENSMNDPQLKIGVNLIVYALTQPGGITGR